MKSMSLQFITILFSLVILFSSTHARQIQVPIIEDRNAVSVKLGLSRVITQPDFEFQKVYQREVHEIRSDGTYAFPPCHENRPEIQFDVVDQIIFEGIPKKPVIITDFQDIKYSQFLLDIYYEAQSSNLFIIFKNGVVAVITMEKDEKIVEKNVFSVEGLSYEQSFLEVGYFIKVSDDLLFVNNNKTIKVTKKSASIVKGFQFHEQFQSVHVLENGTFGVLQTRKGITVYSYDGKVVQKISEIKPKQLFSSELVRPGMKDLVYWPEKKTLLLLDKFDGIRSYSLSISQASVPDSSSNNTDAQQKKVVTIKQTQRLSRATGCKLMYLYTDTLYVYCDILYAYDLQQWPRVNERRLPYPNIEVQQIYEVDNLIALVGKNVFSVLYLERVVNYYEDGNLDKLLFYKDMFISANEQGVDIGNVVIIKPYITCQSDNDKYLGVTQLQFKTKAECNQKYLEQYKIPSQSLGSLKQDDVCIYTVKKPISFWKEGQIKTFPFFIAIVVILVVAIAAVVVFLIKKRRISRVMQMINEYSSVHPQSESAKPHHLNQEMDENFESNAQKAQARDKKDKEEKQQDDKKPSEIQLAENMHDIA